METRTLITANWLTRKPASLAGLLTWALSLILFATSYIYLNASYGADLWMPASRRLVFEDHQYWRLWTTLFAHGDMGHLLSNALLFIPFAYFLSAYFGPFFFPLFGILSGAAINAIVLQTMRPDIYLIGISGVVSWMGAAWLTLFLLIETRATLRRRLAIALLTSFVLFVPETYKQEVSYFSHLIGFIMGVISSIGYFIMNRARFFAAEVRETIVEENENPWEPEMSVYETSPPSSVVSPLRDSSKDAFRSSSCTCPT